MPYTISYPIPFHYLRYGYLAIAIIIQLILLRRGIYLPGKILTLLSPFFFIFVLPLITNQIHAGMFLWFPYGLIIIGAASFIIFSWKNEKVILHLFFMVFIISSFYIEMLLLDHTNNLTGISYIFKENYLYYQLSKLLLSAFLYCALYLFKYVSYQKFVEAERLNLELTNLVNNLDIKVKERTIELNFQNKKIKEVTFTNSHRVRSCVARIAGLINLMEFELTSEDKEVIFSKNQRDY